MTTTIARLGLGTVQFGQDYGISNRDGRPDEEEVAAILARASELGFGYIDTAPAYGDAEVLVGRHLPLAGHGLRVVTKTPAIAEAVIEARHGQLLRESLAASLNRLRTDKVHGLLIHRAADLAKPGWQYIVDALTDLQTRGLVGRIGASIYDADHLSLVESRFKPQLVQLPLNALDRRAIVSGALTRLKTAGAEIHARSVFLQGLLLMQPNALPEFFIPVRDKIDVMHRRWAEQGRSALSGCLAFALQQADIDAIIVGVNRVPELDEIVAAVRSTGPVKLEAPPEVDSRYLDPSLWPAFTRQ